MLYIGVDLGTSACKLLLADEDGRVLRTVSKSYPLSMPQPGHSEQDPQLWYEACIAGVKELLEGRDAAAVQGLGVGGQMHGLVVLDREDKIIRPAILWNDSRTEQEVAQLNEEPGRAELCRRTGNIAFAGFTAPKLLWMRRCEPENFARIHKIMLPKDYLVYRLTGCHATDYSDASGTLLLDVAHRCWSREMLELCGIQQEQLPKLYESAQPVGAVVPAAARAMGLPDGVIVCAGAGDNAAAAVGTGTVGRGRCNISLGTSGTIFISSEKFAADPSYGLHAFAHADGGWHLMGCMLSAASCCQWWQSAILEQPDHAKEQARIPKEALGRNRVFFLPYLMGERSPINDTNARGTFVGMSMDTTRQDMTQAVLEGVAFAIRDSFEQAKALGISIPRSGICGGGSRSMLWQTILANVLGIPLDTVRTAEGPGYGAALLAMTACGRFGSVAEACDALVQVESTVEPDPALTARYDRRYRQFKRIYPACKPLFAALRDTNEE